MFFVLCFAFLSILATFLLAVGGSVARKRYVNTPLLEPENRTLFGKVVFSDPFQLRILKWRDHPGLFGGKGAGGLNSRTSITQKILDTKKRRRQCDHRDRDQSDAAISKGHLEPPEVGLESSQAPSEGARPQLHPDFRLWSRALQRTCVCCFTPSVYWVHYSSHRKLTQRCFIYLYSLYLIFFLMWIIFKVFIAFVTILFLFLCFWFGAPRHVGS